MTEEQSQRGEDGGLAPLMFRESALEKLALQDELDQLFLPTPRFNVLFWVGMLLGIAAAVVWVAL